MNEIETTPTAEEQRPSEQSPNDHGTVSVETEYKKDEAGTQIPPRPSEQSPGDHGAPVEIPTKPY